ncbi:hypothetical protein VTH06DRAFT_4147, partial [Thermothelomyces fergusii]
MATITNPSAGSCNKDDSNDNHNNNHSRNAQDDDSRQGGGTASDGAGLFRGVKLAQKKKLINLLRGWPAPSLLPAADLREAAGEVLSDPAVAVPALQYAIDPGFQPLREEIARWLDALYPRYAPPGQGAAAAAAAAVS